MLRQTAKALERERKPRRVRAGSCGRVQKATRLAQCGGGVGGRGSPQGHPTPWSHTHATPSRGTLCRTRPATGGARVSLAPRQAGPRGHSHLPAPSQGPWTPGSGTCILPPWGTGIRNNTQKLRPCRLAQPRGTHQERLDTRALQAPGQTRGKVWTSVQGPRRKPPRERSRGGSPDPPTAGRTQWPESATSGRPGLSISRGCWGVGCPTQGLLAHQHWGTRFQPWRGAGAGSGEVGMVR